MHPLMGESWRTGIRDIGGPSVNPISVNGESTVDIDSVVSKLKEFSLDAASCYCQQ
jgi:hypothetical protein